MYPTNSLLFILSMRRFHLAGPSEADADVAAGYLLSLCPSATLPILTPISTTTAATTTMTADNHATKAITKSSSSSSSSSLSNHHHHHHQSNLISLLHALYTTMSTPHDLVSGKGVLPHLPQNYPRFRLFSRMLRLLSVELSTTARMLEQGSVTQPHLLPPTHNPHPIFIFPTLT